MQLIASGLTKTFQSANRTLTLTYPPIAVSTGKLTLVVGPSGVGKTTLLSILGGLAKPSSGRISTDPPDHRPSDLVCWIGQTINALPARTVIDNVMLGALASGERRRTAHRRASESLEALGIRSLAQSSGRRVSGGELQRVTVARAMSTDRQFIFADEPTGNLDRANSTLVMKALKAARDERSMGVVMVTHDTDLLGVADEVIEL